MMVNMRALKEVRKMQAVVLGKDVEHLFYDMQRDGVTQSLIAMWLTCREKAKLYLEGWDSKYHKEALIDGNIGHAVLEVAYTEIKNRRLKGIPSVQKTRLYVDTVEHQWYLENPRPSSEAREMVDKACAVIEVMLPLYFDFWNKDFTQKRWVSLEEKFRMPLEIGVGNNRVMVPMMGKKDGTFETSKGIWLFETKFKAMIDEAGMSETLSFETQVMLYLTQTWGSLAGRQVPRGCLYNVIRRPGNKRRIKESIPEFAKRLKKDVEKRPDFYFTRLQSPTTLTELSKFKAELESIVLDMYRWWRGAAPHYKNTYSCIGKYGKCQYLPVCSRGDYGTLAKRKAVFKELEDY